MLLIPWAPVISVYYSMSDDLGRNINLLLRVFFVNVKCLLDDNIFAVVIWQISYFFSILKITAIIIYKLRARQPKFQGNSIRNDGRKRYEGRGI